MSLSSVHGACSEALAEAIALLDMRMPARHAAVTTHAHTYAQAVLAVNAFALARETLCAWLLWHGSVWPPRSNRYRAVPTGHGMQRPGQHAYATSAVFEGIDSPFCGLC